jgi:hypothetical protein
MASAQANRTFGVTYSGGTNAIISNFATSKGRLHAANTQDIVHPNNYANVQWVAGPSESSGSIIAYAKFNAEGNPVVVSTIGDQGSDGTPGTADAYIGFKRVSNDAEFVAAIMSIAAAQGNPNDFTESVPTTSSTATEAKTFADADLPYWTNYTVTEAPGPGGGEETSYRYYTITRCGGTTQYVMRAPGTGLILANDQGYDLSAVIISEGAAPGTHIVVVSGPEESGTEDFAIGSLPSTLECTA